jgi:hypothetical protein
MLCPTVQNEKISEVFQAYSKLKKTSKNKWIILYVVHFYFFISNNLVNGKNGILRDNLKNFETGHSGSGTGKFCPAGL